MKLLIESEIFTPGQISKIQEHYDAFYLLETCLRPTRKDRVGWLNFPVAVFCHRQEKNIPEGGSKYFGLCFDNSEPWSSNRPIVILNAISACEPFTGVVADNGDLIYSRYRHDYRVSPDRSVWIDGGRDYVRSLPLHTSRFATIRIDEGQVLKEMK